MALCEMLSDKLNAFYEYEDEKEKISIQPSTAVEGGFEFTGGLFDEHFPNSYTKPRKSMRMRVHVNKYDGIVWPTDWDEWLTSDDILWPKYSHGHTYLKAFDTAPVWTMEELEIFMKCFEAFDFNIVKVPPKKKRLHYDRNRI